MKKLRSRRGETLVETLTALLIAVLVMGFLTTAILAAAEINRNVSETDTSFRYSAATTEKSITVTVTKDGETSGISVPVTEHTDGKYRYYTE